MKMAFIGIDPGGSGCAAMINQHGGYMFHDWAGIFPAHRQLEIWASESDSNLKIGLEDPAYLPHRSGFYGIKGLWRNVGQWEGILTSLGLEWVFIKPQVWRRIIPKRPGKNTKHSSFEFARSILPKGQKYIYHKKHHNRAEALLIAIYLREFEKIRRRRIQ